MIPTNSNGDAIIRSTAIMVVLSTISVGLRFLARARTKAKTGADDWWAVTSLIFFDLYMGLQIWSVLSGGAGHPLTTLPHPALELLLKSLQIEISFSVTTTAAAKISVLCLYRRVFPITSISRASLAVGLLVVACWLTSIFGAIFRCIPVQAAWQKLLPARCINFAAFFLGVELFNCTLDIIILSMPIPVIRGLQMPLRRKIQLIIIFLLGGFVLIAGVIRMATSYRADSNDLNFINLLIWATIENGLAIICACLPTYKPLLPKSSILDSTFGKWYKSLLSGTLVRQARRSDRTAKDQHQDHHAQLHDGTAVHVHLTEVIRVHSTESTDIAGLAYPLHTIRVKDEVEIV